MRWSRSCPNSFSGWKVHAKRPLEPTILGAAKTRIVGSDGVSTWLMMLIILMVDLLLMSLLDEKIKKTCWYIAYCCISTMVFMSLVYHT